MIPGATPALRRSSPPDCSTHRRRSSACVQAHALRRHVICRASRPGSISTRLPPTRTCRAAPKRVWVRQSVRNRAKLAACKRHRHGRSGRHPAARNIRANECIWPSDARRRSSRGFSDDLPLDRRACLRQAPHTKRSTSRLFGSASWQGREKPRRHDAVNWPQERTGAWSRVRVVPMGNIAMGPDSLDAWLANGAPHAMCSARRCTRPTNSTAFCAGGAGR